MNPPAPSPLSLEEARALRASGHWKALVDRTAAIPTEELFGEPELAFLAAVGYRRTGETSTALQLLERVEPEARRRGDRRLIGEVINLAGNALWKRPDGTVVQKGDSVLITITVVDPKQFNFRFEPSGLQFRADKPAELRISYKWADRDFNGDGDEDNDDARFNFGIWKQETDASDWIRIGTVKDADLEELRADIRGFTRYAIAGA